MNCLNILLIFTLSTVSYSQKNNELIGTAWTLQLFESEPKVVDSLIFFNDGAVKRYHTATEFPGFSIGTYFTKAGKVFLAFIEISYEENGDIDFDIVAKEEFQIKGDSLIYLKGIGDFGFEESPYKYNFIRFESH